MTEQATSYVASSIDRKVISSETYRNKVTTQKKSVNIRRENSKKVPGAQANGHLASNSALC